MAARRRDTVCISGKTGAGVEALLDALSAKLAQSMEQVRGGRRHVGVAAAWACSCAPAASAAPAHEQPLRDALPGLALRGCACLGLRVRAPRVLAQRRLAGLRMQACAVPPSLQALAQQGLPLGLLLPSLPL